MVKRLPLDGLSTWAPFKIDALGLVTLLGQEQVNAKLGRLVREGYLDFMPLLGAMVVAGDLFRDRQAGFSLYNITSGITTPEMAGWFTRWLTAQGFDKDKRDVVWEIQDQRRSYARMNWIAFMVAFFFQAGFLALTVLIGDWYGIANSLSMIASVLVRVYVLKANRDGIDNATEAATNQARQREAADPTEQLTQEVTILCILDDATPLIIKTPEHLIRACFVATPDPPHPDRYLLARASGWVFFFVYIISIGQSILVSQMVSITLLVVPTVALVALPEHWRTRCLGCNEEFIATKLRARKVPRKAHGPRRVHLYAMCQFTRKEEETMVHWSMMPRPSNEKWWKEYGKAKHDYLQVNPEAYRHDPDDVSPIRTLGSLVQHDPANSQPAPTLSTPPTTPVSNSTTGQGE
jgi:hypothetical protein